MSYLVCFVMSQYVTLSLARVSYLSWSSVTIIWLGILWLSDINTLSTMPTLCFPSVLQHLSTNPDYLGWTPWAVYSEKSTQHDYEASPSTIMWPVRPEHNYHPVQRGRRCIPSSHLCTQRLRLVTSLSTILMFFSLSDAWHLNMYNETKPRISQYSTSVCYSQEKWKVMAQNNQRPLKTQMIAVVPTHWQEWTLLFAVHLVCR